MAQQDGSKKLRLNACFNWNYPVHFELHITQHTTA
jgi:hypothetical protein